MNRIQTFRQMFNFSWVIAAVGLLPLGTMADAPAPRPSQARFEIQWMKNMIDHHHMAVMMGELCLEKDIVHPELEALCEDIVTSQTAEIEQMQDWLLDWYGVTYEPQMKPRDERMMAQLAELDGEEFEVAFMVMMIPHHMMAIHEAMMALRRAYHPELKELASNIIETQSAEIIQMRDWLWEWYDLGHGRGHMKGHRH